MTNLVKSVLDKVSIEAERRAMAQAIAELDRTASLDLERVGRQARLLQPEVAAEILTREEQLMLKAHDLTLEAAGPLLPFVSELKELLDLLEPLAGPHEYERLRARLQKYLPHDCPPFEEMTFPGFYEVLRAMLPQLLEDKFGDKSDTRRLFRANFIELETQLKHVQHMSSSPPGRFTEDSIAVVAAKASKRLRLLTRHAVRFGLLRFWRDEQDVVDVVGRKQNGRSQPADRITRASWSLSFQLVIVPRLMQDHERLFGHTTARRRFKADEHGQALSIDGRPAVWSFREDGSLIADRPLALADEGDGSVGEYIRSEVEEELAVCRALIIEIAGRVSADRSDGERAKTSQIIGGTFEKNPQFSSDAEGVNSCSTASLPTDQRIDLAIGELQRDPNQSDRDIAKRIGIAQSTLSKSDRWQLARKAVARALVSGRKFDRVVEADQQCDE